MKHKFKCACIYLVTMVLIVSVAGCSGSQKVQSDKGGESTSQQESTVLSDEKELEEENLNLTGMPIVNETITLKMMSGRNQFHTEWDDMLIWKEYEKRSGIHVEWEDIPEASLVERRNIILASGGDLPDAFFRAALSYQDISTYSEQGVLIPLNELIDKYAPNLKSWFERYPDIKKGLTLPDGNIYSLPMILDGDFPSLLCGGKLWVNKKWMDKLNIQPPSTTEEFFQMLKKFKENDVLSNGENNQIALGGSSIGGIFNALKGSWGLGNRGNLHWLVDFDESNGKLRFTAADPKYKEALQYFNRLYTEGLLDPEIFTNDFAKLIAKGGEGRLGVFAELGAPQLIGEEYAGDYIGLPPMEGPSGDRIWNAVWSPLIFTGAFAITNTNKDPEATIRWIDYFYGEEGTLLFFMGVEGQTYKVNDKGDYEYVDEITNNPDGLTFDEAIGKYMCWGGGGYPAPAMQKFFRGSETFPIAVETGEKLKPYFPKEVWSGFSYTKEETEKMIPIQTDLSTYVFEMMAQFIIGEASFDEWDEYLETLDKMKVDEYMEIYQAAYERYIGK